MAHKRMFSLDIIASDIFLEMPTSSRELYFQLGMYADDDGFVNPKKIMRMVGANGDDLKILIAKRFLLELPNGVVVVKHWLINNTIRKDRYNPTQYLEERKGLFIKDNGAYTDTATNGKPFGNQLATQYRIEEDRIGKKRITAKADWKQDYRENPKLSNADETKKLIERLKK